MSKGNVQPTIRFERYLLMAVSYFETERYDVKKVRFNN